MTTKTIFEALDHSQAHHDLVLARFQAAGAIVDTDTPLTYFYNDGVHKFVADSGCSVEVYSPIPPMAAADPAEAAAEPAPKRRRRAEPAS